MTKKVEKTNVEYLRELIDKGQEERMEFLEAIENELSEAKDKISELEDQLETCKEDSVEEDEELEYENTIDVNMGPKDFLYWQCNNIAIQVLMEVFEEKLKKLGHIKLETALNDL